MTHLVFALTAPADKAVFARIQDAYNDLDGFVARLCAKKIDVQHFEAMRRERAVYTEIDDGLAGLTPEQASELTAGNADSPNLLNRYYLTRRAIDIYLRALLLQLLDEEDAWQATEDAKQAAKAAKNDAA